MSKKMSKHKSESSSGNNSSSSLSSSSSSHSSSKSSTPPRGTGVRKDKPATPGKLTDSNQFTRTPVCFTCMSRPDDSNKEKLRTCYWCKHSFCPNDITEENVLEGASVWLCSSCIKQKAPLTTLKNSLKRGTKICLSCDTDVSESSPGAFACSTCGYLSCAKCSVACVCNKHFCKPHSGWHQKECTTLKEKREEERKKRGESSSNGDCEHCWCGLDLADANCSICNEQVCNFHIKKCVVCGFSLCMRHSGEHTHPEHQSKFKAWDSKDLSEKEQIAKCFATCTECKKNLHPTYHFECHTCADTLCGDHANSCDQCGDPFCPAHLTDHSEECEKKRNERDKDKEAEAKRLQDSALKCIVCQTKLHPDYHFDCQKCGNKICDDHADSCATCLDYFCPSHLTEHSEECKLKTKALKDKLEAKLAILEAESRGEDISTCSECYAVLRPEGIRRACYTCGDPLCEDHMQICKDCHTEQCPAHLADHDEECKAHKAASERQEAAAAHLASLEAKLNTHTCTECDSVFHTPHPKECSYCISREEGSVKNCLLCDSCARHCGICNEYFHESCKNLDATEHMLQLNPKTKEKEKEKKQQQGSKRKRGDEESDKMDESKLEDSRSSSSSSSSSSEPAAKRSRTEAGHPLLPPAINHKAVLDLMYKLDSVQYSFYSSKPGYSAERTKHLTEKLNSKQKELLKSIGSMTIEQLGTMPDGIRKAADWIRVLMFPASPK